MVPRIVFTLVVEHKRWEIPAILGLRMCAGCRPTVTRFELLVDGGDAIASRLLSLRPGSKHVETRLEWIPLTHPDYLKLKGMGPS